MRNMKAVLVLLFFSCSVISASAQSSGSNTQKPPASRAKPSPTPKDPAAGGGTKAKKLVAIEPLPVFCVKDRKFTEVTGKPCDPGYVELKTGNGSDLAKTLSSGNFSAAPAGNDWIAIYCTNIPVCGNASDFADLEKTITDQAEPAFKFEEEVEVPRGQAARIAQKVSDLNSAGISAGVVNGNTIRLKSDTLPRRSDLDTLRDRIRLLGWDREVAPPTQRMFELDAGMVAKCLGASGCPDSSNKGQAVDTTPATPKKDTGGGTPDDKQQPKTQNTPAPKTNDGSTDGKGQPAAGGNNKNPGNVTNPGDKTGGNGTGKKDGNGTGKKDGNGTGKKDGDATGKKSGGGTGGKKLGIAPMLQPISLTAGSKEGSQGAAASGSRSGASQNRGAGQARDGGNRNKPVHGQNNPPPGNPPQTEPPQPSPPQNTGDKADDTSNGSGPDIKSVADMLIFSNSDGSDKGIWEKHRLITILDLPRPEVLMNVWSFQTSSGDPQRVKREFEEIRQTVAEHNEALQSAIQYGWDYLSRSMACKPGADEGESCTKLCDPADPGHPGPPQHCFYKNPTFFDPDFYNYITQRFVDDCPGCTQPWEGSDAGHGAIQPIDHKPKEPRAELKKLFNICPDSRYCLGYTHAFDPVRPTLTNIILTMIASKNPESTALTTAACMEGNWSPMADVCFPFRHNFAKILDEAGQRKNPKEPDEAVQTGDHKDANQAPQGDQKKPDQARKPQDQKEPLTDVEKRDKERLQRANDLEQTLRKDLTSKSESRVRDMAKCVRSTLVSKSTHFDCELQDRAALEIQLEVGFPETLQLSCFKAQVAESMLSIGDLSTFRGDDLSELAHVTAGQFGDEYQATMKQRDTKYATTGIRLLRSAIADFLFNYKMATQYPHDFVPYDLDQSAQELNAQLNPLIVAFNRDVAAFTEHLEAELTCRYPNGSWKDWFTKQKNTFRNDGEITVRGISGVESVVNTITQSYFDATKPPSITDLVNSVSDAETKIPGVLKSNLTANEASVIIGALNSVKPAQAKIGREFDVDITPHTLAGASGAELDVQLTVQETTDPTLFTADKSSEDNISRVGQHKIKTKVRVDSLKLFEVSSFSALLQRPKSKFPILPPFFEVPYFGSFIGIPISGAKEYHRSTAIVSAIIVPTAFDLAYGIDFTGDRVCEKVSVAAYPAAPKYECHRALSLDDLHRLPIRTFHKKIVECFASAARCPAGGAEGIDFTTVPPAD